MKGKTFCLSGVLRESFAMEVAKVVFSRASFVELWFAIATRKV